jgi:phage regulator Rha-like protein
MNNLIIPDETIIRKIYSIRKHKVMIDSDLAELYGIPTKRINEQVKRNSERFPQDFMFQLTLEEEQLLRSQIATSKEKQTDTAKGGRRTLPFAFTEQGVLMLSSVLNSKKAIEVNIRLVRLFINLRDMLISNKEILSELETIKKTIGKHDTYLKQLFQYLHHYSEKEKEPRKRIGFKE